MLFDEFEPCRSRESRSKAILKESIGIVFAPISFLEMNICSNNHKII